MLEPTKVIILLSTNKILNLDNDIAVGDVIKIEPIYKSIYTDEKTNRSIEYSVVRMND